MLKLGSRTRAIWGVSAMLLGGLSGALPVAAAPFTCSAFKDRLGGALVAAGDPNSEPPAYKETRAMENGGSHMNWETSALSGSLTCRSSDQFGEFYVTLNVTSRDRFVEQLKRLVTLNGAAICTLATAAPAACADAGKLLLQDALEKMGSGFKRRATNPVGLSDQMLWPDVKAELTAAPSLLTFSLAARDGAEPDAERRSLQMPNPPPAAAAPPAAAPPPAP